MSRHYSLILFFCSAIALAGCQQKSVPQASVPAPAPVKVQALPVPAAFTFERLSAKGKAQIEFNKDQFSSAINLRIRRDSAIWLSIVPGLGIEVARVLFTQDSVYLLNRLEKSYFIADYKSFSKRFQIPAGYAEVQALLVGTMPFPTGPDARLLQSEPLLQIQQRTDNLKIDTFLDPQLMKLKKIHIADSVSSSSLAVTYADFGALDNFVFPYSAIFLAQQTGAKAKSAVLSVNYGKVSLSETRLSFPFAVPAGYIRVR